jgi:hypothetical protein
MATQPVSDAERFAAVVRRYYAEAEDEIIRKVARRLRKGIDYPGWAEKKAHEITELNREIQPIITGLGRHSAEIEEALRKAEQAGADRAAAELKAAGVTDIGAPAGRQAALKLMVQDLIGALDATHPHILRAAQDAFRSVIADSSAQALIGTATRRQAAQAALNRFADIGITGFVDTRGRRWDLTSYTEMATRTTVHQSALQSHDAVLQEAGEDLVIVSAHWDSCPLCAVWEGRVLSLTGATPGYPTKADAKSEGLFHPNCGHRTYLYTPGLTEPVPKTPDEVPGYRERMAQRYNERQIRKWKRRELVALDDRERLLASQKVKAWQGRQRALIRDTGRRRDYWREQVEGAR